MNAVLETKQLHENNLEANKRFQPSYNYTNPNRINQLFKINRIRVSAFDNKISIDPVC